MKKFILFLFISIATSASVNAQSEQVKQEQKTLKNSIKDKKEDKHEVAKDLANGRVKAAVKDRKEVRRHRASIHKQGKHLQRHGVKRPIHKAKVQAKKEKDIKNGKL